MKGECSEKVGLSWLCLVVVMFAMSVYLDYRECDCVFEAGTDVGSS